MSKYKGTRGLWAVKHSESKEAWNIIGTTLGGKYKVARCPYFPFEKDEAKANAQLMASAPELLEMLSKVLEINAHHRFDGHKVNDQIMKVISKATTIS